MTAELYKEQFTLGLSWQPIAIKHIYLILLPPTTCNKQIKTSTSYKCCYKINVQEDTTNTDDIMNMFLNINKCK